MSDSDSNSDSDLSSMESSDSDSTTESDFESSDSDSDYEYYRRKKEEQIQSIRNVTVAIDEKNPEAVRPVTIAEIDSDSSIGPNETKTKDETKTKVEKQTEKTAHDLLVKLESLPLTLAKETSNTIEVYQQNYKKQQLLHAKQREQWTAFAMDAVFRIFNSIEGKRTLDRYKDLLTKKELEELNALRDTLEQINIGQSKDKIKEKKFRENRRALRKVLLDNKEKLAHCLADSTSGTSDQPPANNTDQPPANNITTKDVKKLAKRAEIQIQKDAVSKLLIETTKERDTLTKNETLLQTTVISIGKKIFKQKEKKQVLEVQLETVTEERKKEIEAEIKALKLSIENANKELAQAQGKLKDIESAIKDLEQRKASDRDLLADLETQLAEIDEDTALEALQAQMEALMEDLDKIEMFDQELLYIKAYGKRLDSIYQNLLDNKPPTKELLMVPTLFFTCKNAGIANRPGSAFVLDNMIRMLISFIPGFQTCFFQKKIDKTSIKIPKNRLVLRMQDSPSYVDKAANHVEILDKTIETSETAGLSDQIKHNENYLGDATGPYGQAAIKANQAYRVYKKSKGVWDAANKLRNLSTVADAAQSLNAHCRIPMMIINALFGKFEDKECQRSEDIPLFFTSMDNDEEKKFEDEDTANIWYGKRDWPLDKAPKSIYDIKSDPPDSTSVNALKMKAKDKLSSISTNLGLKKDPKIAERELRKAQNDKRLAKESDQRYKDLNSGKFTPLPESTSMFMKRRRELRKYMDQLPDLNDKQYTLARLSFLSDYSPFADLPEYDKSKMNPVAQIFLASLDLASMAWNAATDGISRIGSGVWNTLTGSTEEKKPKGPPVDPEISLGEIVFRLSSPYTMLHVSYYMMGMSAETIMGGINAILKFFGQSELDASGSSAPYCKDGCNRKRFLGVWMRHMNINVNMEPNLPYDHIGNLLYIDFEGVKTWQPYYTRDPSVKPEKGVKSEKDEVLADQARYKRSTYIEDVVGKDASKMNKGELLIYKRMVKAGFTATLKSTDAVIKQDKLLTTISANFASFTKEKKRLQKLQRENTDRFQSTTLARDSLQNKINSQLSEIEQKSNLVRQQRKKKNDLKEKMETTQRGLEEKEKKEKKLKDEAALLNDKISGIRASGLARLYDGELVDFESAEGQKPVSARRQVIDIRKRLSIQYKTEYDCLTSYIRFVQGEMKLRNERVREINASLHETRERYAAARGQIDEKIDDIHGTYVGEITKFDNIERAIKSL